MATKANILLMDEDLPVRQALERALTVENFQVVFAASMHEAEQRFGETHIDVLLLGLNSRNESGWDTVQRLTALQPLLPVIITTARPGHQMSANTLTVDAWMEKPLDLPVLIQTLNELASQTPDDRRRLVNERPASAGNSLLRV
jgi:two-component system response regulator MprA